MYLTHPFFSLSFAGLLSEWREVSTGRFQCSMGVHARRNSHHFGRRNEQAVEEGTRSLICSTEDETILCHLRRTWFFRADEIFFSLSHQTLWLSIKRRRFLRKRKQFFSSVSLPASGMRVFTEQNNFSFFFKQKMPE